MNKVKYIKMTSQLCIVCSLTCTHRVYCFDYYYMLQKVVDLF